MLMGLSDNLFRTTLDALGEAVLVFSPEGRVVHCNAMAETFLALGLEDMQRKGLPEWKLLREDGTPWPVEGLPVARSIAHRENVRDALVGYVLPAGNIVWTLANSAPLLDPESGELRAVVLSIRDITDRKRGEDQQKKLNRTLAALNAADWALLQARGEAAYVQEVCRVVVEQCGHAMAWVGFALHDPEQSVQPVAHFGFEDGYLEALNLTWADEERGRGPTGTAIRTGKASICNNMLTDPAFVPWREAALKRGYASSIALPLMDGSGCLGALTIYSRLPAPFVEDEVGLLQELANDLAYGIGSLRIKAAHGLQEVALKKSEERYRMLVEQMADGIFVADAQGRYLDVNPVGAAMLGYTQEEICTLSVADVVAPEEVDRIPTEVEGFAAGAVVTSEWRFRRKDGSTFIGEVVGRRAPDGRLQAVLRDVTDRREAEDALRDARLAALNLAQDALAARSDAEKANRSLEAEVAERRATMVELERAREDAHAANQAKSEFLANLSHEIRTPLNAVLGLAQVGRRDHAGQPGQDIFDRILQSGELLLSLINDVLDFSKIEAGKMTLEDEPFDPGDVLDRVLAVNASRAYVFHPV